MPRLTTINLEIRRSNIDATTDSNDLPKLVSPARRALQNAGITTLEQLTEVTEKELLQLHGMGPQRTWGTEVSA